MLHLSSPSAIPTEVQDLRKNVSGFLVSLYSQATFWGRGTIFLVESHPQPSDYYLTLPSHNKNL